MSAEDEKVAAETVIHEIPDVVRFVVVPNGTPLTEDEQRFGTFLRGFCAGAMYEHHTTSAATKATP